VSRADEHPPASDHAAGAAGDVSQPTPADSLGEDAETRESFDRVERDLDSLLASAEAKRDEYLELARRTQADFENYRKRMAADMQAALVRGKVELAGTIVNVADTLELALRSYGVDPDNEEDASDDGKAFLLIYRQVREALEGAGIEAIDPQGERFDPQLHEALSTAPAEGVESGQVVQVVQKGYRLGDQLVRPARVVVSE